MLNLLKTQLDRLRNAEHTFMIIVGIIIGVVGGYGAIIFRYLIGLFKRIFFGDFQLSLEYLEGLPWYVKLLVPAIGGLLGGPIIYFFAREAKGAGVPEVMEAMALKGGVIRPRVVIAKTLASAIFIGSGGSVGREGPIAQIGAATGSVFGQLLKVRSSQLRTIVACGAAAGIAGTFNAPIAGAIFSLEILLGNFAILHFSPIVIASVTSTVISRHYLGNYPAFIIPAFELTSVYEFIPYTILGVLSAIVALFFTKVIFMSTDAFERLPIPEWLTPAIGGLIVGATGIFFPQIFGVGYETMDLALAGKLTWSFLLVLVFLKLFATSITIGSGGSGGIFAPSLFLGAALGGVVGTLGHAWFPEVIGSPGAYTLVGMGAVAAATMHAPITSILILFELTNDYRIILPLMVSIILSVVIKMNLMGDSIYTLKLKRRGLDLKKEVTANLLSTTIVADVLKDNFIAVQRNTPFKRLYELTMETHHLNYFVIDEHTHLLGILSPYKIREIARLHDPDEVHMQAKDLIIKEGIFFTPEDTLDKIVPLFHDFILDQVPIVNNAEERILIGQVTKTDLLDAYNKLVTKRDMAGAISTSITSAEKYKEIPLSDGELMCEVEVPGNFVGRSLMELDLRNKHKIEVILIKQNYDPKDKEAGKIVTPEPHYKFQYGDRILVLGHQEDVIRFKTLS